MKHRLTKYLSLVLAGLLQILPLVRTALPSFLNAVRSPMGSLIARWVAGGVAYLGYDAISGATSLNYSISISPPTATQGKFYSGSISWSGGYAGETTSMAINGMCLGSYSPSPGLTITYNGGATATMQGIPTSSNLFTVTSEIYRYSGCYGGSTGYYEALRTSPKFTVISSNGLYIAPSFNNPPQNLVAVVGTPVTLFGGALANPPPTYQWNQNLVAIAGATNAAYTIANPQLTNAGTYSLTAININTNTTPPTTNHPSSFCVLSVCLPPGTNFAVLDWTNYVLAGVPITMTSFFTNTPSATNTTYWAVNGSPYLATNQNFSLTAAQAIPSKSGTYSVFFSSVNGTNVYANQVECDTQWQFGYLPVVTNQPTPLTVGAGSNATFTCTLAGGNIPFVYLYQNGTNLVAQTNFPAYNPGTATATTNLSLTISNVTQANAGNYTFVITNFWGSITSSPAALTVITPLSVTSPASQTNYAGKDVTLNVTAAGTPPLNFQWQKGGLNLSDGGNISGSLTNSLNINPAAPANSGNYQVVVNNTSGSVTSSVATVTILPVPKFGLSLNSANVELTASGGVPGSNYVVQVSTNLASSAWLSLYTNTVQGNGVIDFTDTNALTNLQRFYRVQFP